jgi:single-stranded-DNA-specific exonuclease
MAAGLEIEADRLDDFRGALVAHATARLRDEDLVRVDRVDAVVPGGVLTLDLVEQLEQLQPFGMGNPAVKLLVPSARVSDVRAIGDGRHSRFTATSGGVRAPVVAFGSGASPSGLSKDNSTERRYDIVARLERNDWQGAVESRLVLGALHAVEDRDSETCEVCACLQGGDRWWDAVLAELEPSDADLPGGQAERTIVDRRGKGVFGTLGALLATGESVAIACADAPRRHAALEREFALSQFAERCGGRVLVSDYCCLEREVSVLEDYQHLFMLDPPPLGSLLDGLARHPARGGGGFVHWGWGAPEVEFASRALEAGYALRDTLRVVYSALAAEPGETIAGPALEAVLRGAGTYPRSPAVAGRCLRILVELQLVELERSSGTVRCTITEAERVDLETSQVYTSLARRCQEGLIFLNRLTRQRSAAQAA